MILLFGGEEYYPRGGWADFIGSYSTLEEATEHIRNLTAIADRCFFLEPNDPDYEQHDQIDWWQIVQDGRPVLLGTREYRSRPEERVWWEETTNVWWEGIKL